MYIYSRKQQETHFFNMHKHQSIIKAIEADDLKRARRLIDKELVPKRSRAFDDIAVEVRRAFVSAGKKCPLLSVMHQSEVQRAAIGVDSFMERFGIDIKSSNRILAAKLVCRGIIDFIRVLPDDASEDEVKEHFKVMPYLRALHALADVDKITSYINAQFPDYLDSGLAMMLGFEITSDIGGK